MPRFLRLVLASTVLLSACADPPAKTWTPLRRPSETAPNATGKAGDDGDAPGAPAAIPPALPKRAGVVFVHGTGDAGKTTDLACSGAGDAFKCVVPGPVADYWTPENIDSQRRRGDGSLRPYAVVGCPLGSQTPWTNPSPVKNRSGASPEPGSADCVAAQARRFLDGPDGKPGTDDDVTDVAIVTHSGGSNVVRYILAQRTKSADFARLHAAARRVVALAPPTRGTYLANYMFREGSLGNTLNGLIGLFGILRMRTYGVLALFGAGVLLPWTVFSHSYHGAAVHSVLSDGMIYVMGLTAAGLLIAASAPFLRPVLRFIASGVPSRSA